MKTLKSTLSENTKRAQQKIQKKTLSTNAVRAQSDKALRKRCLEEAAGIFKKELPQIIAASTKGETSYRIPLLHFGSAIPDSVEYVAKALQSLFVQEGLIAEIIREEREPFGSDPLFDDTTYSVDVRVRWAVDMKK